MAEGRTFCRYERCRSKLASPVEHRTKAFCSKHCREAFFKKRCIVCEDYAPRVTCSAKKCQSEYRRFPHLFALKAPTLRETTQRLQKCPENRPFEPHLIGPEDAPINLLGRSRYTFDKAPQLDPALRAAILATESRLESGKPARR